MTQKTSPVRQRIRPTNLDQFNECPSRSSDNIQSVAIAEHQRNPLEACGMAIEWRRISALTPYGSNARTHSKKQVRKLADSIETFGFLIPIVIDPGGEIIAGHGRLEAVRLLGLETVPTIRIDHLTEEMKRAFRVADNHIATLADWDEGLLAVELQELVELDLDFKIEATGFETAEIDLLIEGLECSEEPDDADDPPATSENEPVISRVGDLWLLGDNRLHCASALEASSFETLMTGNEAELVFTDPPYNVPIKGNVGGLGVVQHKDFVMAAGEMSESEFIEFLFTSLNLTAENSADGAIHFICMDWRHQRELLTVGRRVYSELKNLCVWAKTNAGMGTFYRSQHELVFAFKAGTAPHINNFELGQYGRHRSNVWTYAGVNSFGTDRLDELAMHPTVKPVAMVADAIRDCSRRNGIVLDPFAGSGTTIVAAEKTGRRAYAMELEPRYVDVAIRRWQNFTGEHACHAVTTQTFDELTRLRPGDGSTEPSARDGVQSQNEEIDHVE
jgi:DNA modification methylase